MITIRRQAPTLVFDSSPSIDRHERRPISPWSSASGLTYLSCRGGREEAASRNGEAGTETVGWRGSVGVLRSGSRDGQQDGHDLQQERDTVVGGSGIRTKSTLDARTTKRLPRDRQDRGRENRVYLQRTYHRQLLSSRCLSFESLPTPRHSPLRLQATSRVWSGSTALLRANHRDETIIVSGPPIGRVARKITPKPRKSHIDRDVANKKSSPVRQSPLGFICI